MDHKNMMANIFFGRNFPTDGTCVCHGRTVTEASFRNEISKKEYLISRLCQESQDDFFGSNSNDDGEDW